MKKTSETTMKKPRFLRNYFTPNSQTEPPNFLDPSIPSIRQLMERTGRTEQELPRVMNGLLERMLELEGYSTPETRAAKIREIIEKLPCPPLPDKNPE